MEVWKKNILQKVLILIISIALCVFCSWFWKWKKASLVLVEYHWVLIMFARNEGGCLDLH